MLVRPVDQAGFSSAVPPTTLAYVQRDEADRVLLLHLKLKEQRQCVEDHCKQVGSWLIYQCTCRVTSKHREGLVTAHSQPCTCTVS